MAKPGPTKNRKGTKDPLSQPKYQDPLKNNQPDVLRNKPIKIPVCHDIGVRAVTN